MRIIKKLEQVVSVISHASLPTSKCLKQYITFIRSIVMAKFQPFQINIQLLTIELVYNEMWEIQVGKKKRKKKRKKGHQSKCIIRHKIKLENVNHAFFTLAKCQPRTPLLI